MGNNLSQDPAIQHLGIYSKDAQAYYKDICSTMFIVALFVKARTWNDFSFISFSAEELWIYYLDFESFTRDH